MFRWVDESCQQSSCSPATTSFSHCNTGRSNCFRNQFGYCWGKSVFKLIFQHRLEKSWTVVGWPPYSRGLLRFIAEVLFCGLWGLKEQYRLRGLSETELGSSHRLPFFLLSAGYQPPCNCLGQFSAFRACSLHLCAHRLYCLVCSVEQRTPWDIKKYLRSVSSLLHQENLGRRHWDGFSAGENRQGLGEGKGALLCSSWGFAAVCPLGYWTWNKISE